VIAASLTRAELLALPAAIDLVTAGRALGIGRTRAHELARGGDFPLPVLRLGREYRVATAELLCLLGIESAARAHTDDTPPATCDDRVASGSAIRREESG